MDEAMRPLPPGPLVRIASDALQVHIAPAAGGRIAQITCDGAGWLAGYDADNAAAIAWGCFAMLPWAGRIRRGRFGFGGRELALPANLGAHAIHGVGFVLPWEIAAHSGSRADLVLALPRDASWPFGGRAMQSLQVQGRKLRLELAVQAGVQPMPRPVMGWHPWFVKPDKLDFAPTHHYARDAEGIATRTMAGVPPAPWDDCFINTRPAHLFRHDQVLRLASDCDHWVVFDERSHATCVEPQSGPPDAFNLRAGQQLEPGASITAWFELEWL